MRKVYQSEKRPLALVVSVLCSAGVTLALFAALPFAHRMAKSDKAVELVKTSTAELPPPVDDPEPPPAPEPEKKEEPKRGLGLGALKQNVAPEKQTAQVSASGGARGVGPDRLAKGGSNPNPVKVSVSAAEIDAFRKGIA